MIALFRKYPGYKWFLAACDFAVLNAAFAIALRLRFRPHIDVINLQDLTVAQEVIAFAFYSLIWVLVFQWLDLYKRHIIFAGAEQVVAILRGQWMALIGLVLIQFFLHPFRVTLESRLMFVYFVLLSSVGLIVYRLWFVRRFFRSALYRRFAKERALILGTGEGARLLAGNLRGAGQFHTEIAGFLSDEEPAGTRVAGELPVLGRLDQAEEIIRRHAVNSVYLAENIQPVEKLLEVMETLSSLDVELQMNLPRFSVLHEKVAVERVAGSPLVRMTSGQSHMLFRIAKRITDVIGALAGLLILSPLFLYIACQIKRSSKGPVFFKQTRIGRKGRPFAFHKFRTMTVGSEVDDDRRRKMSEAIHGSKETEHGLAKIVNEQRVTEFGKWLRKHSLDELPQLLNVLLGDMSLVGPRPCLPYEWEAYKEWHRKRLDAKPGCTGLWQVVGRSETSHEDMVILDLYYIQNMSPWLDLQLILRTIPVMLTGKGGG